jgi:dsDNA-specific endonuclease/ATPase MutS2
MTKIEKPTADVIHEAEETLDTFYEYTRKLVESLQQEKEKVRMQALQESRNIIEQAEHKARQIYVRAMQDAARESSEILTKSRELAKLIVSEAERFTKAVTKLEQNTEQEIEAAKVKVRQEADVIAEAVYEGEKSIGDAKDKLKNEFEESVRVVTEIRQKLEQATKAAESKTEKEITRPAEPVKQSTAIPRDREKVAETTKAEVHERSTERHNYEPIVGTMALDVSSKDSVQLERFQKYLTKIRNLEVSPLDNAAKGKIRITVFASEPLPLLSMLNEMALVKSAVPDKDCIRVILEESDLWRG